MSVSDARYLTVSIIAGVMLALGFNIADDLHRIATALENLDTCPHHTETP